MPIASFSFLGFALLVVVIYNCFKGVAWRRSVLFAANIVFLLTYSLNLKTFVPLLSFIICGYVAIRIMQRPHRREIFITVVVLTVLAFIWLKKYTFLPHASFLPFAYLTLGLSFVFFRVMHLIIDSHQGGINDEVGFVSYLNYTLNFTTLVSGPIQSYPDFIGQHLPLVRPELTIINIGNGLERVIVGFFKVNVIALILSIIQNHAIIALSPEQPLLTRSVTGAIIAATYPVYLYYNFSGYTDIVIGIASFMRITLPENFNRPFSTDNFLEFWNHWHITLSGWLKKYVYNPTLLSLMRRFPSQKAELSIGVFAFFLTFFLIGIWHGRTSEFLFYGLLLGAGVSINKIYQVKLAKALGRKRYKLLSQSFWYECVCKGLNFTFFAFYLLWFWSTWHEIGRMRSLLGGSALWITWLMIFIASALFLTLWGILRSNILRVHFRGDCVITSRYFRTVWDTGLVFILVGVMELLNTPAPDIVYKAF